MEPRILASLCPPECSASRESSSLQVDSELRRFLPREEVLSGAQEYARELAANTAPVSVAIAKKLLWEGIDASVDEMKEREDPLFAWTGNQPDAREGVLSFVEKRQPEWALKPSTDLPESVR